MTIYLINWWIFLVSSWINFPFLFIFCCNRLEYIAVILLSKLIWSSRPLLCFILLFWISWASRFLLWFKLWFNFILMSTEMFFLVPESTWASSFDINSLAGPAIPLKFHFLNPLAFVTLHFLDIYVWPHTLLYSMFINLVLLSYFKLRRNHWSYVYLTLWT